MEPSHQQSHHQSIAIALSLSLHLLLLVGSYYFTMSKPAIIHTNYSITFNSQQSAPAPQASKYPATTSSPKKNTKPTPKKPTPATLNPQKQTLPSDKAPKMIEKEPAKEVQQPEIDERGLYQTQQGKQTAAKLDLTGWIWDTAPQPEDDTEESGKIIFEIKIDDSGEIIAVRTLEKTVSPSVEKIYKEALTELTFSRTADHIAYAPLYVGRVTFILRTK